MSNRFYRKLINLLVENGIHKMNAVNTIAIINHRIKGLNEFNIRLISETCSNMNEYSKLEYLSELVGETALPVMVIILNNFERNLIK